MVQFVFTPWRNRAELLRVRSQLYPHPSFTTQTAAATTTTTTTTPPLPPRSPWWSGPEELRAIESAIARVFMWVHRGGCPHVVESTALLMSAIVFDERGGHDAVSGAGVTAGYVVGFTRFVTGLLDSHQDKARKLSMYGVAKTLGLPASFVELRHQGTHEPMPSLGQLRPAARRALVWIWEYYWKNLPEGEAEEDEEEEEEKEAITSRDGPTTTATTARNSTRATAIIRSGAAALRDEASVAAKGKTVATSEAIQERMCRTALLGFLQRQEGEIGEEAGREGLMRQLGRWDEVLVLRVLADIGGSIRDTGMLLRSVKLARVVRGGLSVERAAVEEEPSGQQQEGNEEELRGELYRARDEVQRREGVGAGPGMVITGKRKKEDSDKKHGGDDRATKRGVWFRWEGPWSPKPIGVL